MSKVLMDLMFFTEAQISKDNSIGITNLLSNITTREGSHKGGWTRLLKCQLLNCGYKNVKILDNQDKLSDFDVIIFDLGAEYSGALNMFGGLDEKVFKRLREIQNHDGLFFSWRNQIPNLKILKQRRNNESTCEDFKKSNEIFLDSVIEELLCTTVFQHTYKTDSLLIGDSHSPSVWDPSCMIERADGRTLFGMNRDMTVVELCKKFDWIQNIMIHASSIDIRHHLMRQDDPEQATASLVINLVGQIYEASEAIDRDLNVTLVHTVGIEDESRKLPKTGFYKGTAFFGTWEQRNRLRSIFNEVINDYTKGCPGWNHIEYPKYFFDDAGKMQEQFMEVPASVHTSPQHYRWNLEENKERWPMMELLAANEKDMYGS